jgi:hypothetical protein
MGRYIFGLSAIGFGISSLVWRDFINSDLLKTHPGAPIAIVAYVLGIAQIAGGAAILWPRTARVGAIVLGAVYVFLSLLGMPFVIKHPLVFNGWGNLFETVSLFAAAAILYAWSGPTPPPRAAAFARLGYYAFGISVISFGLEQAFYLPPTVALVPKWIPLGQTFWGYATTVAFFLAGIALLSGFLAKLASQLNTAMLLGFGILVWVPILTVDPKNYSNWSEALETFAIAGASWVVTEYIALQGRSKAA